MNNVQDNSFGYYSIIPADVMFCKNLEPMAKLLYGQITSLTQREGHCWATNKYLANANDVDERTIQRWLESLEENGFIYKEIDRSGFKTSRKIFISSEIKKISTSRQKCQEGGTKMSGGGDKNVTSSNMNIKQEQEKKEQQQQAAAVFSHLLKDFSNAEQDEMLAAIEKYNISEERIRLAVDHIKRSHETVKSNVKFFVWHCREKIPPKLVPKENDSNKQIALNYNEQLSKLEKFKKVFEKNKTLIEQGVMFIFENGGFPQVSLRSNEFQNDILKSRKQLGEMLS